ncbi:alpha/beta hydrolase [Streptomyces sp. NPDC042898]|uniref:alpha/beta fold hydrolase n=1 Tax=Streptomyces sp. NPDC042898 TaxID=3154334 RepID=UPI0033E60932
MEVTVGATRAVKGSHDQGSVLSFEEFVVSAFGGYKSEGRTLWHRDPSAGTVVLIGGALQRKTAWGRFEAVLAQRFHVFTVDLPGWGDADTLPASYGVDFLAAALHDLLGAAGHRRVHVLGASYGSGIAYRYAQTYPEAVRSLTLAGPLLWVPDEVRENLGRSVHLLEGERMEEFAELSAGTILRSRPGAKVTRQSAVRRILHSMFRGIDDADGRKYRNNTLRVLRQAPSPQPPISAPVLVTTGEHDLFTPPDLCREVASLCPDVRFTLMYDADHAMHLELPDQAGDLLTRFASGESLDGLAYCHPVSAALRPSAGCVRQTYGDDRMRCSPQDAPPSLPLPRAGISPQGTPPLRRT